VKWRQVDPWMLGAFKKRSFQKVSRRVEIKQRKQKNAKASFQNTEKEATGNESAAQ